MITVYARYMTTVMEPTAEVLLADAVRRLDSVLRTSTNRQIHVQLNAVRQNILAGIAHLGSEHDGTATA